MSTAFWRWLQEQGAQNDFVEWARPYESDWERAWNACPRGDWLLALAARRGADRVALVRAACACAELALDYVPEDETRAHRALDLARRWLANDDDASERARACEDVEHAIDEAPDPAVAAAATAALSALRAIDVPADAALAAASSVQAAVFDAAECAMMSAMGYAEHTCAERVREHLPFTAVASQR